jgi:MFS family permease
LIIIGAFKKAASQNYAMWIWVPIIQQLGSAIVSMSAPPYITETAYPSHRGKAVAMYSVTYQLGALIAAGLGSLESSYDLGLAWLAHDASSTINYPADFGISYTKVSSMADLQ